MTRPKPPVEVVEEATTPAPPPSTTPSDPQDPASQAVADHDPEAQQAPITPAGIYTGPHGVADPSPVTVVPLIWTTFTPLLISETTPEITVTSEATSLSKL